MASRPNAPSLPALALSLLIALSLGLGGCVATGLPTASVSPWERIDLDVVANPLDVAFTDARHGFLVGSNRMILETQDGGASWDPKQLTLPEEENFRLISIDFDGDDGWIAGQPGLLMHSSDGGANWTRLFLDTKLPGEPYLITALGRGRAELATNVGAIYHTDDSGNSWEADVTDAAGAVRDLRRDERGRYVSVSSLGNFYATWAPGDPVWQVHQRASSQRLQSLGFQPGGDLWMVARGAQIRLNEDPSDQESWSKPIVPITNGYGYLDLAWDGDGTIWAGGGNGTLLSSRDGGESWERDPVGRDSATNFTRFVFSPDGKAFVLGERGLLLRRVA
ncbi:photosynthesis system II assembly factor Ycf48 [Synechococcus sp. RSCCF101]|uniref:photosynthesis system II assembly factor Ycf48 n=1 Tax=Synechococcus sp. RSCCF101 TaxID=2511069 RepID=UPI001243EB8B|nr:photosynthesis system II assembly factor Ycf48 [Synechococcus sp. RSCCF101]QEY32315.1 photosynthesis system II assembly factor Ycf48 [Synechococcus sp. RSCCF101]